MGVVRKQFFLPLLILIILLFVGFIYIGSFLSKEDWLSEAKVRSQLEEMYEGTVATIEVKNNVYVADMTRAGALYTVAVDPENGTVLSMKQLSEMVIETPTLLAEKEVEEIIEKEYEEVKEVRLNESKAPPVYEAETVKDKEVVKVDVDATSGEVKKEKPKASTSPNALISKERAIEIALGQLRGDIEYVKFEKTNDGGFYLIEIEKDDDEDDLEAIIQIHAITGKVMSVIWDD